MFRFAQSPRSQWRAGIGFNWLDDPIDTNFGFNFTYGFDLFPRRPWVLSTELDWGTLGEAELLRACSVLTLVAAGGSPRGVAAPSCNGRLKAEFDCHGRRLVVE